MLTFEASVSGSQVADQLLEDNEEFGEFMSRLAEVIPTMSLEERGILISDMKSQFSNAEREAVLKVIKFLSMIGE